jgi:hypothetical protein
MTKTEKKNLADAALHIRAAARALTEAIDRDDLGPMLLGDYLGDVERWCGHARSHLNATYRREARRKVP